MGRILLTAAPGGHSGYAYAIGYHLSRMGLEVHFLTTGSEWLVEKLSRVGQVHTAPMPRRPGEPLAATLHRWPGALVRAWRVVAKFKPAALVACGSNFSIPPALAARLRGIPLYNVESIVRILEPGRTPRILHRISRATLLHWPEQLRHYPGGRVVGPIYEPPEYSPRDEGYVLVTAGTLGNAELFKAVVESGLPGRAVIQTGRVDPEPLRRLRPDWVYIRYTPDLGRLISGASVVVTQFPGMTSATAALAYSKPVVMVPARHLRLSASLDNARVYAKKIGAVYLEEVTPEAILEAIEGARRTPRQSHPDGAREAARIIAEEVGDP